MDKNLTPSASTEELQVLTDVSQAIQVETGGAETGVLTVPGKFECFVADNERP